MKQKRLRSAPKKIRIPPATGKSQPQRILVVDDDLFACHRNAEVLIRQGYEVTTSEYCETGWEELQATPYSLLIAKREMPNMTGAELVMLLRSARISLPVILIAEKMPPVHPTRQLQLHPAVTLLKPYTPDEILTAVRGCLKIMP
jgi:DNA-binding response OmpR family regulator